MSYSVRSWTGPAPLIIGHRGASADAPENTLEAFALAAEQGADGIELDVQLAADGVPVVIHDTIVDRTTDATGSVTAFHSAHLKSLGVPALSDVFGSFGTSLLYNVELKTMRLGTAQLAAAVTSDIAAHGLEDAVLISSFNPLALRTADRVRLRGTRLALLHVSGWGRAFHRLLNVDALHPYYGLVNAEFMFWARHRGYHVNVWTVDEGSEAQRLCGLGVHAIITNRPGVLRDQLGR